MAEEIDPKTGMKIRKLTELKATAAKDYQTAMLNRVEYFANKKDSIFNNVIENAVVKTMSVILDAKVKLDSMIKEETRNKIYDAVEKLLLMF